MYKIIWIAGLMAAMCLYPERGTCQSLTGADDQFRIPPMRMLIDSALVHSPVLKTKDIEVAIREMEMRALRWEWTNFIQPFAEYRYGTVDNYLVVNQNVVDAQQTQAHRFSIGGRINLTVFNAVENIYKQKIAGKQVEADAARRVELEKVVKEEVIRLYNMVVTYKDIVTLKSDHMSIQALNLSEAKMRYEAGEIPIMELARITEIESKSKEDFYMAIKEFRESVYLLQEMVGGGDFTTWTTYLK